MSERSTDQESSFTWPPPADDMDQLSILDLSQKQLPSDLAPVPQTLHVSEERARRAPGVAAGVWQKAGTHALAGAGGRLVLFAAGVLVGAVLVGAAIEPWASGSGVGHAAPTARVATPEGDALHAMQAVLRGERPPEALRDESAVPLAVGPPEPSELAPSPPSEDGALTPAQSAAAGSGTKALVPASGSSAVQGPRLSEEVAPTPVVPRMDSRAVRVRYALGDYERAVTRSDASATRKVWPSANAKALTNAFTAVREQRLQLGACDVDVQGERATAICRGTLRYRPRVGDSSTRIRRGQWEFQLERAQGRWIIRSVDAP